MNNDRRLYISVEERYNEFAKDSWIKKANEKCFSDYISNVYEKYINSTDAKSVMTKLEFAAYTSNHNPNRSGIGEAAQLECLRSKFLEIQLLPKRGINSITISRNNGAIYIRKGIKSNINGMKTLDAIAEYDDKIILFILKTVDIGEHSISMGGGHQKNVENELNAFVREIGNETLSFRDKNVEVMILIDGRSSIKIIESCKKLTNNTSIIISSVNSIIGVDLNE